MVEKEVETIETPLRINIIGIPVDVIEPEKLERYLQRFLREKKPSQIIFISLWDIIRAKFNKKFRYCLIEAGMLVPVSKGIVIGAIIQNKTKPIRYYPFRFMVKTLNYLADKKFSIYILGGNQYELQKVEKNISGTFPGIRVIGRYPGKHPNWQEKNILLSIKKSSPHLTIIGRNIRQQEMWIYKNRDHLNSGLFIYSPLCFDIFSQKRKKASDKIFRLGFDFIPILLRKPWRIVRVVPYMYYVFLLLIYRIARK